MPNDNVPAFRPLTGLYEPSAIQQLPDGRFIVVEDEKSHPLSLVTIGADGSVASTALTTRLLQMFSAFWQLDELEGLALDRAGFDIRIMVFSTQAGIGAAESACVGGLYLSGTSRISALFRSG